MHNFVVFRPLSTLCLTPLPAGFLLSSGADYQTQLNILKQGWPNSNDCPLSSMGLPLLSIPYAVSTFTNVQYFEGRPLRNCSYLHSSRQASSMIQEITCTFDIDLALVVRVADALNYLPTLNTTPPPSPQLTPSKLVPPAPLVPSNPPVHSPPPPRAGSPPSLPPPPVEGAGGASGPTLAFFANLTPPVLAAAWKDIFTYQLNNALGGKEAGGAGLPWVPAQQVEMQTRQTPNQLFLMSQPITSTGRVPPCAMTGLQLMLKCVYLILDSCLLLASAWTQPLCLIRLPTQAQHLRCNPTCPAVLQASLTHNCSRL